MARQVVQSITSSPICHAASLALPMITATRAVCKLYSACICPYNTFAVKLIPLMKERMHMSKLPAILLQLYETCQCWVLLWSVVKRCDV